MGTQFKFFEITDESDLVMLSEQGWKIISVYMDTTKGQLMAVGQMESTGDIIRYKPQPRPEINRNMSEDEVRNWLIDITYKLGGIEREDEVIIDETQFIELGLDSMTMMDIIFETEIKFGISVDDNEITRYNSVGEMVNYIMDKIS